MNTSSDLSGAEWVPIGSSASTAFTGTFDGQGYVIRNLTITGDGYENNGLFGYITSAYVKNVGLENTNINVSRSSATRVGAICGGSNGHISNCYNTGNVSGVTNANISIQGVSAGGICGNMGISSSYPMPTLSNCFNTGDISAKSTTSAGTVSAYAGGIAGQIGVDAIKIGNSFNTGAVYSNASSTAQNGGGANSYAGGICGSNGWSMLTTGNVYRCYNAGSVTSISIYTAYAGGISGSGGQTNCFNTGTISATGGRLVRAGGIAGNIGSGVRGNCYSTGIVSASAPSVNLGGLIGSTSGSAPNYYCLDLYGSEYGTQLTSAQMKNKASFVGFDFDTVWDIDPAVNDGYPFLRELQGTAATYTLTLNANGGSVTPTSVTQAQGTTYTLPTPTPTPALSGYTFTGWTLSGGGSLSGNVYTFGTSNGTVTAGWTANATSYAVAVNNGSGGGNYAANATVTITANTAPTGKVFDKWTSSDGVSFANANAVTTTFSMPAKNVSVTATYKDAPPTKNYIFNTSYEATLIKSHIQNTIRPSIPFISRPKFILP
ncbi:MAG: InlB B-repeat-containing protein [Dehalococcoidia bacterium]|nr:InlB B-repeat-containing protein [Dehalococcoidia bacterium]